MKRAYLFKTIAIVFSLLSVMHLFSQDSDDEKDAKPVRKPFNANQLIDLQTVVQPTEKSLELIIHHRFGTFKNKLSDLYGIYAPSNIRLGLNYGISDKFMVGVGTEKDNKLQDVQWKYRLVEQTKSGSMPVSFSYYGNVAVDARNEAVFGEGDISISSRMTYFHQLIITRKFNKNLSVVVAPGFSHINMVDSVKQNDVLSASVGVKYTITRKLTILTEYDHPFYLKEKKDYQELPKPNLGVALEIGTSTHVFQITCSQFKNIIPQRNFIYNENALDAGGWLIGFNINVKF